MFRCSLVLSALGVVCLAGALPARAEVAQISASRDNTLYEPEPAQGLSSNGAGSHFFVGRTAAFSTGTLRRGVIAFDIAAEVPPGATITAATLTLYMSKTNDFAPAADVTLQRLTADWGEAGSDAPMEEGGGAPAQTGDATWEHASFDTDFWTTSGGDFVAVLSATTLVDGEGPYSWSSSQLTADVQDMLDSPAANYGWILIGDEDLLQTTKRFDSRTNLFPDQRPVLEVEFTAPVPTLSQWGLVAMTAVLLVAGGIVIRRHQRRLQPLG